MNYGIVRANKLVKQNRKILVNTADTSSATSTPVYSYGNFNENTDSTSKKLLTAEAHSRTIFFLEDKTSDTIQNRSTSIPYSKDTFI